MVVVVMVVMMGDCAVLTNFYGGWLNEELKIVLADRDQQDGID